MNPPKIILGLDVSKAKLDACLRLPQPRTCSVPNTPAGHAQLLAWAAPAAPLHLCLEATSTSGFPVARHAHAAGHPVSLRQPWPSTATPQATLQAQSRLRTELVQARQGWTNRLATAAAVGRPVLRQVIRSLRQRSLKCSTQAAVSLAVTLATWL